MTHEIETVGDLVDGHTVAVWQGGRLKIAGRYPVDT
jgi:hypothetical protein